MKLRVKKILIFLIITLFTLPISLVFSQGSEKPKILMERTRLESPKGMKIYEFQRLQVDQGLLNSLSMQQGLNQKSMMLAETQRGNVNVFMEKNTQISRLVTNQTLGHVNLLSHVEKIAKTKPILLQQGAAFNKALSHVNTLKLIPKDVSNLSPSKLVTLSAADVKQDGKLGASRDVIQTVLFARTVNNKPVLGKGSQLHVDLGGQGNLEGFSRKWNKMAESKITPVFRNDNEVYGEIEKIITKQFTGNVTVKVQNPRLVYFGDDGKFVQPSYRFEAEITSPNAIGKIYYDGVVSALRNSPEPVRKQRDPQTRELPSTMRAELSPVQLAQTEDDPIICRYAVRNDSSDWVDDANDFKNGLISGHYSGLPALTFADWYWDEPRFWTTQQNSFVDKCHVTLMEGHGNHWLFTTRSNCCDVVDLNAASQPGYGDKAGDSMRYLVLKGCSIVPAPPDRSDGNWAAPWWRIFKGLRQAVGFRTTMYINDDISDNFGYWIGKNCRVLDSWFYATNTNSSYAWNRFWGAHVTGYGSVVMIPGHEGDGIYHTAAAPPATTTGLTMYWQH
jgi:hypothetical protein